MQHRVKYDTLSYAVLNLTKTQIHCLDFIVCRCCYHQLTFEYLSKNATWRTVNMIAVLVIARSSAWRYLSNSCTSDPTTIAHNPTSCQHCNKSGYFFFILNMFCTRKLSVDLSSFRLPTRANLRRSITSRDYFYPNGSIIKRICLKIGSNQGYMGNDYMCREKKILGNIQWEICASSVPIQDTNLVSTVLSGDPGHQ